MLLPMSDKERDRLKVIEQVHQGQLSQAKAAQLLALSQRQVRRLHKRYDEEGDRGLIHRSRDRPSNRRIPSSLRAKAVQRLKTEYQGFGPTLASQKLAQRDGIQISRETVRQWLIEEELWVPKPRGVTHRQWRERRDCYGEMVQMDTSEHDWFEGRGEQAVLIAIVDDATSRLCARFFPSDTTHSNMTMLRDYIHSHGRPRSLYADKASHFHTTRSATLEEQLQGREAETQIGRALRELGIEYIPAHSPQAKGRVERCFGTLQDRLIKELRLEGISTIEQANHFLKHVFLAHYNERFSVPPASPVDAHRPLHGHDLEAILSRQEMRTVANDYTLRHRGRRYQILPSSIKPGLRGSKVTVEERLEGSLQLRYKDHYLEWKLLPDTPKSQPTESPRPGRKPRSRATPPKPPPDHPWRKSFKAWFAEGGR